MPINWNAVLPTEGSTVVGWSAAVVVVLGGAGWGLFVFGLSEGADKAKNQLAFYQSATAAKLPELSANLVDISNDLKASFKIYERNKELETKISSYQQQLEEAAKTRADRDTTISHMKKELQQSEAREGDLKAEIAKLTGESRKFSLTAHHAEQLIAGYSIGFNGTIGTSIAILIYDNKDIHAGPGYTIKVEGDGKSCILTVLSVDFPPERVNFDFTCKRNN